MVGVEFETRRRLSRQLPQLCLLQVFRVCEVFNLVLSDLRETSEGTSGGLGHSVFWGPGGPHPQSQVPLLSNQCPKFYMRLDESVISTYIIILQTPQLNLRSSLKLQEASDYLGAILEAFYLYVTQAER